MLAGIVRSAIRLRGAVIVLACMMLGYGVYSVSRAKFDVFPEFAPPLAIVQAQAPGLSAEQVEQLVTQPIENALGGLLGLQTMKSKSLPGLSLVTLTFGARSDVLQARQQVSERLAGVGAALPAGVAPPALLPLTSSTSVVMVAALTSRTASLARLTDLARWTIRPHLLGLPGIADVVVFGGERRQLQVQVDPQRLASHNLTLSDVAAAARQATGIRAGGVIEGPNQRLAIRTEGQLRTTAELGQAPVTVAGGVPVRLADVADVRMAPQTPVGAATLNGQPSVMLVIESQYGADPLTVTATLERAAAAMAPLLAAQHASLDTTVFRPATSITTALGHLRTALVIGAVLVIAVLLLFLHNLRTAAISACAIPLSLLAAVIVLERFGVSLNTMTLGGLAIALGEVVDDAIIDVENIHRRLRANRELAQPLPAPLVVWHASLEVRSAVVYATFMVMLVFVPVLMLPGVTGRLFAPLGIAYMLAVLASLGVALTVTPALAAWLLADAPLRATEPRLVAWLKTRYAAQLGRVERRPGRIVAVVAVLCVAALASLPWLGASLIPQLKEGHYTVHTALAPGTSLAETIRIGNRLGAALRGIPGVRLVAQRAGRAGDVVDPVDVNVSEFEVDLQPMGGAAQDRVLGRIRDVLARFPGMTTSVNSFLAERIDETITGQTAPLVVEVHGNDLDAIDATARDVLRVLRQVPGAVGVGMQAPPGTPQLLVRLRPPMLQRYAVRAVDVLDAVRTAFSGADVAQLVQGNRVTPVVVQLAPAHRRSPADIAALRVRSGLGTMVPLRELAQIDQVSGRSQIAHDFGQRVQTVSAAVRGRSIAQFAADAQARIARQVRVPPGMYLVFTGEAQERARAQQSLLVDAALALAGIVLLSWLALRSIRLVALVLANLPFALVGGVAAVLLTGAQLSLGSLVGFVTLCGITLRNSIMLVSHYQHLVQAEDAPWDLRTAMRGASERLVPILMTACVTALALLPLALSAGEPGNEVEGPLAIVILGGLVTSTLLNLLVLPTLALRFGRFAKRPVDEWPAAEPLRAPLS